MAAFRAGWYVSGAQRHTHCCIILGFSLPRAGKPPVTDTSSDPASHYDRVTAAWGPLFGDDLHYGLFETGTPRPWRRRPRPSPSAWRRRRGSLPVSRCSTSAAAPAHRPVPSPVTTRARVTGITTSAVGVEAATQRATAAGVSDLARFEIRDGTDNGFPDASFDRVWVLESSHLMPARGRLISECARVLRRAGCWRSATSSCAARCPSRRSVASTAS